MFGPIRTLCFAAGLYLPLSLFLWFAFAGAVVTPVLWLTKAILVAWMPEIFVDIERQQYAFSVLTSLVTDPKLLSQAQAGQRVVLDFQVNPMIYGYGLPVIAGLALATPNSLNTRLRQIAVGAVCIWLVQVNGVIWDTLQNVCSNIDGGVAAVAKHVNLELLAGLYQFSYLILPPLVPVILWALMNQKFINDLIHLDHIASGNED
jgi:hypothetical protein